MRPPASCRGGLALRALLAAVACIAALSLLAPVAARAEEASSAQSDPGLAIDTFVASNPSAHGVAVLESSDGSLVVERYYGTADADGVVDVGEQTAFEWGRCSDLVVWACVMQLVEEGEFALTSSLASLLPDEVDLPEGYTGLTMLDLMNHTTGLDVALVRSLSSLPDGTTSALDALALFDVEGGEEPGDVVAYTPYDALLAAVVVEQCAGVDFCTYANENVLDRLGMDGTYLMIGGSASRLVGRDGAPVQAQALARGFQGVQGASSPTSSSSSVLSCLGPADDLLRLAEGLMGLCAEGELFESEDTSARMFEVTRTYPGLGLARVAHGLFAFPLCAGVYGMPATTASGYTVSVYMSPLTGTAAVAAVNESGRADLSQGIMRILFGRDDTAVAGAAGPDNASWVGVYQNASSSTQGVSRLLTALQRTVVEVNEQGVLMFDGRTATALGAGVYSVDDALDQDVYRFHVSLARGNEFSRVASDSFAVPASTLRVEAALGVGALLALVGSFLYAFAGLWSLVRARIHRKRWAGQCSCLVLSLLTNAAGVWAIVSTLRLAEGLDSSALSVWLVGEAVYVAVALLISVWVFVTRWRGSSYSRRQNVAAAAVMACALAMVLNLVYWEMLP